VLIVEDDQVIAYVHAYYVEQCGHEVTACVESGELALESVRQNLPDVVLMDIRIDGPMSGIDVAKEIKINWDIPVIFISGNSDSWTQAELADSGMLAFLVKPIHPDHLKKYLEEV
jgi:CheY-like chemotaxis protein